MPRVGVIGSGEGAASPSNPSCPWMSWAPAFCKVLFWSAESLAPKRLPMTDGQAEAQTAAWTLNLCTDYRQMIWSCRIAPKLDHRPDRSDCF